MTRLSPAEQSDLEWVKATASVPGGYCVELALHSRGVALRHSAAPGDDALIFSSYELAAFLDGAKRGEFDHLVDLPAPRDASSESRRPPQVTDSADPSSQ